MELRIDCPFCKAEKSVHCVVSYGMSEAPTGYVVCDNCSRSTWGIDGEMGHWHGLAFHARQMHTREYELALYAPKAE